MKTEKCCAKIILFSVVLGFILILSACSLFADPGEDDDEPGRLSQGISVLSHRGHLYLLGGRNPAGEYSDAVEMASLADDGTLSSWSSQTPLPGARAFHSVVAYGEYLYLIGGENESGYLDDIWFAYVYPDGRLGSSWTKGKYSLPEGRAAAAGFIIDGRMYLAGGEGADGPSDELLSARIWSDGKPGLWAPSPGKLPSAHSGAAVLRVADKVYLAGGKASDACLSDFLISEIATDGTLGAWTAGPSLPDERAFAALVPDGDSVLILGGEAAEVTKTAAYALREGAVWERKPSFDGSWSGQGAVLRGWACLPRSTTGAALGGEASIGLLALSTASAGPPTAKPAGGLVKKDSTVALFAAADETIRYTVASGGAEPPDPDENNSAIYNPESRPVIGANAVLKARSFKAGLEASGIARLAYRVESTSLFYTVEKTLHPASSYLACILQETYSGGTTAPASLVWYELSVADRGWYSLSIRDKDDDAAAYTDSVNITLFESSPLSLLQDSACADIYRRQDDLSVYLAPGTYMLRAASTSGAKGGSFGLRFFRE